MASYALGIFNGIGHALRSCLLLFLLLALALLLLLKCALQRLLLALNTLFVEAIETLLLFLFAELGCGLQTAHG